MVFAYGNRRWTQLGMALLLGGLLGFSAGCGDDNGDGKTSKLRGTLDVLGLFDLYGGTGDVGKGYNRGVLDSIFKINESATGVAGFKVRMKWKNYNYKVPVAEQFYKEAMAEAVPYSTIFGWGTADSMALALKVKEEKIPYISASYAGSLASPEPVASPNVPETSPARQGTPYNFFAGTDYSTALRAAVSFIKEKNATHMTFAYCSAGYCMEPIEAGKSYAKAQSLTLTPDFKFKMTNFVELMEVHCPSDALGTDNVKAWTDCTKKSEVLAEATYEFVGTGHPDKDVPQNGGEFTGIELGDSEDLIRKKVQHWYDDEASKNVQWIWMGNTTKTTVYLTKALKAISPNTKVMTNVWGFDESLSSTCGADCAERLYGTLPFASFGDEVSGMAEVQKLHQEFRSDKEKACDAPPAPSYPVTGYEETATEPNCVCTGDMSSCKDVRYVQGYVSVLLWKEAVKRAAEKNPTAANLTGVEIKEALETLNNFDTGDLTAPITFTPTDHRPQASERIYTVTQSGTLKFERRVDVERSGAEWNNWLGW